ncbi:hypothetical protein VTO42DRAFT_3687 [Malbranchea cinnamomea]
MTTNLPGGFVHPSQSLLSPAPSSALSTTTVTSSLPQQRTHPLKPGSAKENSLIQYVDARLLEINRRHAKKFSSSFSAEDDKDRGYENFREVAKDIEVVADVLWVSGTPSLQTPYLISLAGLVNSYLRDFPFKPRPTFRLLKKLDAMFASLLQGKDVETDAVLPGFETRRDHVSMTEKVRIKSIVESTRITVVETQDKEDSETADAENDENDDMEGDEDTGEFCGDSDDFGIEGYGDGLGRWEMESARVYERTIQVLGDELGKQGPL